MKKGLIYITGGARSGKSAFAERLIQKKGHRVLYIATAVPCDEEMKFRIEKHKERRPALWRTLEAYKGIGHYLAQAGEMYHGIILDCITVMITNILMDKGCMKEEPCPEDGTLLEGPVMAEIKTAIAGIRAWADIGIVVSNEVGMGLVPENPMGRLFRDIAGRANQYIASEADEVYIMISGLPMRLK